MSSFDREHLMYTELVPEYVAHYRIQSNFIEESVSGV